MSTKGYNKNIIDKTESDSYMNTGLNKRLLRRTKIVKRGLMVVTFVGVGAGIYGFKLGRMVGYSKGVSDGYMVASLEFVEALKEHHEDLKTSIKVK